MNRRILVCEDEDAIRDFIMINLTRAEYEPVGADSGEAALEEFDKGGFSVVILDIMMPGIDGFEVCRRIREKDSSVGIIMLTAKSQEADKVTGLSEGADDYITKPFSVSEFTARVDALYRRINRAKENSGSPEDNLVRSGELILDTKARNVIKNGVRIELTPMEYNLLEYFMLNPDIAFDRNSILKKVWKDELYGDIKIVDVNVRRLRMKLEDDPSAPRYLQTVWGYGYKWQDQSGK